MEKLIFLARVGESCSLTTACRVALGRALQVERAGEGQILQSERGGRLRLLVEGIARVFVGEGDAAQATAYFARPDEYVLTEPRAAGQPELHTEAITGVTAVGLSLERLDALTAEYPELVGFACAYLTQVGMRRREARALQSRGAGAERALEVYDEFLRAYPGLETQVPTAYLASYLGLSTREYMRVREQYRQRGVM